VPYRGARFLSCVARATRPRAPYKS
jgi:hypothetical protein